MEDIENKDKTDSFVNLRHPVLGVPLNIREVDHFELQFDSR